MRTLKEIPCGETVKVAKLTGEGAVKRRIMDMGITRGIDVLSERWLRWEILLRLP